MTSETSITIDKFEDYLKTTREQLQQGRKYFRGQPRLASDGYRLIPSIGRYPNFVKMDAQTRAALEQKVLQIFDNHLITYVDHLPRDEWEKLAIAQHHGLPTRFMDLTTNPLAALYFAIRDTEQDCDGNDVDSAVYVLLRDIPRYYDIKREWEDKIEKEKKAIKSPKQSRQKTQQIETPSILSPFTIDRNIIYDPPHVSPRIRVQDSVLLACHQPVVELPEQDYVEIIIKHETHADFRDRLDHYGLFDKQLFPGLEGIARWLKYRVFETDGWV